jgi:hypothetical protein
MTRKSNLWLVSTAIVAGVFLVIAIIPKVLRQGRPAKSTETVAGENGAAMHKSELAAREDGSPTHEHESVTHKENATEGLELPGVDQSEITYATYGALLNQTYAIQDKITSSWPIYAEVRESLLQSLSEQFDVNDLSADELVKRGLEFRQQFWDAGGCNSATSYRAGYSARILMEIAHQKSPDDLNITDELAEAIQSVEYMFRYDENLGRRKRNTTFFDEMRQLRSEQYEQIKKNIQAGQEPTWADFVRVNDLVHIEDLTKNTEPALNALEWLIQNAEKGGWQAYIEQLNRKRKCIEKDVYHGFPIFTDGKDEVEEARYLRRFPSFKGPRVKERGIRPLHLRGGIDWVTDEDR